MKIKEIYYEIKVPIAQFHQETIGFTMELAEGERVSEAVSAARKVAAAQYAKITGRQYPVPRNKDLFEVLFKEANAKNNNNNNHQ
jgi:hypothetical protein